MSADLLPTPTGSIPPISHPEAMALTAAELERTLALLHSLDPHDWSAPTDCPDWDVRRMYLHVLGACEASASIRENLHQMRAARAHRKAYGGPLEAALSAVQVRERSDLSPGQLVRRLAETAPVTIRKRTGLPSAIRRFRLKVDGPVEETWTLGYLVDVIYLRDLWMHRVDAARATGRTLQLSADHDGRIVADVVAEWARRHGKAVALSLTGPAGGRFVAGEAPGRPDDPAIALDAIEFCRTLAGRAPGAGLLATIVPF
ncbi:maleylpyruvate isomerase family mycothiol-dependent enzyme [Rhabdothermincola sp.]|uniref:maleylpyruvate isomerase family mycothiol-dependent enzyme n=1 Tax=Rhabdothermincola sp. TaxID=2820405 RepID=UPI002FE2A44E